MNLLLSLIVLAASHAAAGAPPKVVEAIARQIADRYVLVDEAPRLAERLRERARGGAYDKAESPAALANALTSDLREMSGDKHFAVEHNPERASQLIDAGAGTQRELPELGPTAEERERMRRRNFGFGRVQILAGNVALIEVRNFDPLEVSRDAAVSAMAFAANADAVVFDVRDNPGGKGDLVNLLVSYFLEGGVELMSTFDRETGITTVGHTLADIPGKRMTEVPVFVLTSQWTGSAAEAFAFVLQQVGRATTVGEKTIGAAQGGGWVPVGDGFTVFIPSFRPLNPKTGKNWEGVGVRPDVATSADRAVEVAHHRAVAALDKRESRHELRWLLPLLDLAATGPAAIDIKGLDGRYEGVEISVAGGALKFLGAAGVLRDLTPLSDGTFLIEDAGAPAHSRARVRFVRDAGGACTGLELLTESGRVIPKARM